MSTPHLTTRDREASFVVSWSGDVHGPDRGLLCTLGAAHPIQPPPPILTRCEAPSRKRKKRDDLDLRLASTIQIRALLQARQYTIVALMQEVGISRTSVDVAIKALKYHGLLRMREMPRATYGRKQRVYWIQEDGKTADDGRRFDARGQPVTSPSTGSTAASHRRYVTA